MVIAVFVIAGFIGGFLCGVAFFTRQKPFNPKPGDLIRWRDPNGVERIATFESWNKTDASRLIVVLADTTRSEILMSFKPRAIAQVPNAPLPKDTYRG